MSPYLYKHVFRCEVLCLQAAGAIHQAVAVAVAVAVGGATTLSVPLSHESCTLIDVAMAAAGGGCIIVSVIMVT